MSEQRLTAAQETVAPHTYEATFCDAPGAHEDNTDREDADPAGSGLVGDTGPSAETAGSASGTTRPGTQQHVPAEGKTKCSGSAL